MSTPNESQTQMATLAGGCFWCIDSAFNGRPGILESISGYAGGTEADATYSKVSTGQTAHHEAVQLRFDPKVLSYQDILDIFWQQIDPTDPGGQFADRGPQYKTAIYFHNPEQEAAAQASKKTLENSGKFATPIATEILPYSTFFPAEEEHQNFAQKRREYYQRYKEGSGRAAFIRDNWK